MSLRGMARWSERQHVLLVANRHGLGVSVHASQDLPVAGVSAPAQVSNMVATA